MKRKKEKLFNIEILTKRNISSLSFNFTDSVEINIVLNKCSYPVTLHSTCRRALKLINKPLLIILNTNQSNFRNYSFPRTVINGYCIPFSSLHSNQRRI